MGNTLFGEDEYGQTHCTTESQLTYLTEVNKLIITAQITHLAVITLSSNSLTRVSDTTLGSNILLRQFKYITQASQIPVSAQISD